MLEMWTLTISLPFYPQPKASTIGSPQVSSSSSSSSLLSPSSSSQPSSSNINADSVSPVNSVSALKGRPTSMMTTKGNVLQKAKVRFLFTQKASMSVSYLERNIIIGRSISFYIHRNGKRNQQPKEIFIDLWNSEVYVGLVARHHILTHRMSRHFNQEPPFPWPFNQTITLSRL